MNNDFDFVLKALFVLEIFTFLSRVFDYTENGSVRKLWLISKFMTSQTGQHIITTQMLPNNARSKGNKVLSVNRV